MYAYLALAALKLVGGYQQGDIIRQNGELQSKIQDMNAQFADLDAHNAVEAGYGNAARYETQVGTTNSAVRGAYAGENVAIGYGTAGDVEKDNRVAGMQNVQQIKRNAENAAIGFQGQAINIRLGSQMTKEQANINAASSESQGIMGALSTTVAGIAYDQSTGKGQSSRVGTDDKPVWQKTAQMHINDTGDGVRAPASVGSDGLGWFPDAGRRGQPGFYGQGPREEFGSSSGYSFTNELGG